MKKIKKWLLINDDGTLIISWKQNTEFHHIPDIETTLRQIIHILEQYGNQKITINGKTIIVLGKIAELKKFKDIAEKTLKFLKSSSIDFSTGLVIQHQIELSQKAILTNVDKKIKKDIKIYFAVMKRGLIIKKEIIRSQKIILNIYKELVKSYKSLTDETNQTNLRQIKNKIAGKGANLINGLNLIIVNPYKKRVNLPSVRRLENISNVVSIRQLQKIIKSAFNRLMPAIPKSEIKSEVFLNNKRITNHSQGRG